MSPAEITVLGVGQLVNWGALYYAFAILLPPVQASLDVPPWSVTAAFSLGLLVSAALAPEVGRHSDRGHAPQLLVVGGLSGAGLLGLWALWPSLLTLYVVWLGLGVCMAMALYEPAFAVVTRAHASAEARLRALAVVTLFGGLASTVFLPLTAGLVASLGWRGTVGVLAGLLVVAAVLTALSVRHSSRSDAARADARRASVMRPDHDRRLRTLTVIFGMSSFASAAFVVNLVPVLGERGLSTTDAALLGGLFGAMQLPGRAILARRRAIIAAKVLVAGSLALQAVGLVAVALVPTQVATAAGVMTYAVGSGLTTLARPYVVHAYVATALSGHVNGRVARAQQFARAAGPITASLAAAYSSHAVVLVVLAVTLAWLTWFVTQHPERVSPPCIHSA